MTPVTGVETMHTKIPNFTIQVDTDAVERFVDRLATFCRADWLAVASVSRNAVAWSTSRALLETLIAHHQLGVQTWDAADDVETAIFYSLGPDGLSARQAGASLRTACDAAKTAALALLVRPLLTAGDFETLYRPFATLVPLAG
jgi:hypothetical protein